MIVGEITEKSQSVSKLLGSKKQFIFKRPKKVYFIQNRLVHRVAFN